MTLQQRATGGEEPRTRKRHPKNAAGPFYVVFDCCTVCGVPQALAPELFAVDPDRNNTCYVKRQPSTAQEMEAAIRVVRTQDLHCIRYGGEDEMILRRLAEAGEMAQCDAAPPNEAGPVQGETR